MPQQLMESSIHPSIVVAMAVHTAKHAPSPPLVKFSPPVNLSVCLSACFRRRRRKGMGRLERTPIAQFELHHSAGR